MCLQGSTALRAGGTAWGSRAPLPLFESSCVSFPSVWCYSAELLSNWVSSPACLKRLNVEWAQWNSWYADPPAACHFLETTGKETCTGDIFLLLVSMVSSGAALQLDLQHVKLVKYSSLNERKMFHAQKWMQTLNPFPCAPLSPIPNCWMYSWSSEHIFVYWVTVFCCWNIAVIKYFNLHVEV